MISKPQNNWYWRMWGAVSRWCKAQQVPVPDRHELHARALGADKSHTDFDDDDFDDVMSAFYAIAEPDNFDIQVQFATARKKRRVYACRRNAIRAVGQAGAENYIRSISQDKFGTSDWESLEVEQLKDLRNTLDARAASKRKRVAVASDEPNWTV